MKTAFAYHRYSTEMQRDSYNLVPVDILCQHYSGYAIDLYYLNVIIYYAK